MLLVCFLVFFHEFDIFYFFIGSEKGLATDNVVPADRGSFQRNTNLTYHSYILIRLAPFFFRKGHFLSGPVGEEMSKKDCSSMLN